MSNNEENIKLRPWHFTFLVLGSLLIFLCTPLVGFLLLGNKETLTTILVLLVPVICLSILAVVAVYKIVRLKEKQIEYDTKKARYDILKSEYESKNISYDDLKEKLESFLNKQSNQEKK